MICAKQRAGSNMRLPDKAEYLPTGVLLIGT